MLLETCGLSAVQALCNLIGQVLELQRLDNAIKSTFGHHSTLSGFDLFIESHNQLLVIMLGRHFLLQVQSDTFIVGLLDVSAARRPKPLCAT